MKTLNIGKPVYTQPSTEAYTPNNGVRLPVVFRGRVLFFPDHYADMYTCGLVVIARTGNLSFQRYVFWPNQLPRAEYATLVLRVTALQTELKALAESGWRP